MQEVGADGVYQLSSEPPASEALSASIHLSTPGLVHRTVGGSGGPSYLPELQEPATPAPPPKPAHAGGGTVACESDGASRFICHICLNSPDKPVVTVCGHLYW